MQSMKKIKLLVVDDHLVVRMGLKAILELEPDMSVVGEASNGEMALEACARYQPDVVLMDIRMPKMDGIECTQYLCSLYPKKRVLLLTTFDDAHDIKIALQAGASGCLFKDADPALLVQAIREIHGGERFIQKSVEKRLKESIDIPRLTEGQLSVLRCLVKGYTNSDIALTLGITISGVRRYMEEIFKKLNVADRTEAVAVAIKEHIIKDQEL
jgi:two-component system NarL family response regulator